MKERALSLAACLVFLCCGCSSVRLSQFQEFAKSGKIYTEAVSTLLDQAAASAIETDSRILVQTRDKLTVAERTETVIAHDKLLKERIQLLNDIRRHCRLMDQYFLALEQLAAEDGDSGIGDACAALTESMGQISSRIRNAKVGSMPVSDFTRQASRIVVKRYQRKVLDAELSARTSVIERELDLQQAALKAIGQQMRFEFEMALNQKELETVVRPYRQEEALSSQWVQQRSSYLLMNQSLRDLDAATEAAQQLHQAFIALVENRYTRSDFERVLQETNSAADLLKQIYSQETQTP
jgi:hypothetical protein